MSTHFVGEGNIGSAPEYREFPNGNDEPRRLLRLNVYFDNPIPKKDGEYEDRGAFWAPVELWHRDAEHWKTLYQKGMRVLVEGRTVRDEWEDADENERVTAERAIEYMGLVPGTPLRDIKVDTVFIGSCTNGRISDMRDAAEVLRGRKVAKHLRCIVLPSTPTVWKQCLKEGLIETFMDAGCIVGPCTCGPCLGGHMGILGDGERCIATTNRNFRGRMGHVDSEVYLAGPQVAAASAILGKIAAPKEVR